MSADRSRRACTMQSEADHPNGAGEELHLPVGFRQDRRASPTIRPHVSAATTSIPLTCKDIELDSGILYELSKPDLFRIASRVSAGICHCAQFANKGNEGRAETGFDILEQILGGLRSNWIVQPEGSLGKPSSI